ncbi:MAG TPA: prephenate dehydratase [Terriglobales bacterium]|nr:prephenate dehydratase [Terriglobales bacterium]
MKVAIQGELGSFSHQAALRMLPGCSIVPCARSAEVFDRVARGTWAVIPLENTLAGSVAEHFDLLLTQKAFIRSEFRLRIVHNLIAPRGVRLQDVKRVYSHPVALEQCRNLFRKNKQFEPVPFYDTAGSVKHIVEEKLRDAAAIASRKAASVYQAQILAEGIEDNKQNFTRFVLIHRTRGVAKGANKTSIAFRLKNQAGALFKALSVFALRDIDLSKIESRPLQGSPWEYVFYLDFLRGDDQLARSAVRDLGEMSEMVKILGIYPAR